MVLLLAAVLGLNGADTATISANVGDLERAFHVGNTQIGLLLSVVALTGAVFTVPAGILTDRTKRTRLLAISITGWAAAMSLSGAADSYLWLVLARVGLGLVAAAAGPIIASLTGDYFPAADRGRVYSLILGGELAGTGIGFVVSGNISSVLSWRFAIWWLVLPALALAWAVHRMPEPVRGGQDLPPAGEGSRPPGDLAGATIRQARVEPDPDLVLRSDPARRSIWWAVRYVLRVRTNLVIIVASALGYFYFAGLRSFAIIFAAGHYGLSKPVADSLVLVIGAGAVAGVFVGGRLSDRLLRGGLISARVLIPAVCLLAIGLVLAPAIAATSIAVALPLLTAGSLLLGAANPPMDAARLDIMPARLWGRAEGVRTVLRTLGEAAAPVLFGYVSQYVFVGSGATAGSVGAPSGSGTGSSSGLEGAFLIFLIPLALAGLLALIALRTYPRDVATAQASAAAIRRASGAGQPRTRSREPDR